LDGEIISAGDDSLINSKIDVWINIYYYFF
jgi:hypothetical protein